MYETVVIGLGSTLMGDDGVGVIAARHLEQRSRFEPHVEFVDGGTWGMNLLHHIESADKLLLIDAIDAGVAPGHVVILERDELPRFFATKLSPHQIDLKEVLALAELRDSLPQRTVAIGLQPGRIEMSSELSPLVREGMEDLVQAVVDRLNEWGHARTGETLANA